MTSLLEDACKEKFKEIMENGRIHHNQKIVAADAILDIYNLFSSSKTEEVKDEIPHDSN